MIFLYKIIYYSNYFYILIVMDTLKELRQTLEEPPTPASKSSSRKTKSSATKSSSVAAADATSSINVEKIREKIRRELGQEQAKAESSESPKSQEYYDEYYDEDDYEYYKQEKKTEKEKLTIPGEIADKIREKIKKRMKYIKTVKLLTRDSNGNFIVNSEAQKRLAEIEQIRKILNNINDPDGYQNNDPIWDAFGLQAERKDLKDKLEKIIKKIITVPCNNTIPKEFLKPYKESASERKNNGKSDDKPNMEKIKPLYITLGMNKTTIYRRLYDHLYNLLVPVFNKHINAIYNNVTHEFYEFTFNLLNGNELQSNLLIKANRYTESEAKEIIKQYNQRTYDAKLNYFKDNIFPYLNTDGKFGETIRDTINKKYYNTSSLYLIIRNMIMRDTVNSKIMYNILDLEEKAVREKIFKLFQVFDNTNKCYEEYDTFLKTQPKMNNYVYRLEGTDSYYDILSFKDAYTSFELPRKKVNEQFETNVYKFIKTKPETYLNSLGVVFNDIKRILSGRYDKSIYDYRNLEFNYYNMQKICDEMLKYLNNFAYKDTTDAKIIEIKGKVATIQELLKYCGTMLEKKHFNDNIYYTNPVGYDHLITDIYNYLTEVINTLIQNKDDVLASISEHEFIIPIDPNNINLICTAIRTEYNKYFVNDQKVKVPQFVIAEKYKYSEKIPDLGKGEFEIKFIDIVFDIFTRVRLNSIPTLLSILSAIQALFNCMIEIRNDYYSTDDIKQKYPCIKTLRDNRTKLQRIFDNANTPQALKPLITSVIAYINEYIAIIGSDIRLAKFTERMKGDIPEPTATKRFKEKGGGSRIKRE